MQTAICLTASDVATVRSGFNRVAEDPEAFAQAFYDRLFGIAPGIRPMFPPALHDQGRKLTAALAVVVNGLDRLDSITGPIRLLGARHSSYGVEDWHYGAVGQALMETLQSTLGAAFDDGAATAWGAAYAIVSDTMMAGSHGAALAA